MPYVGPGQIQHAQQEAFNFIVCNSTDPLGHALFADRLGINIRVLLPEFTRMTAAAGCISVPLHASKASTANCVWQQHSTIHICCL